MANKSSVLEQKVVAKISEVYLRLLREKQDEGEVIRYLDAFVQKALLKLGFQMTAERLQERTRQLSRLAIERAKKKMEEENYLRDLKVGSGSSAYTISFLPDVKIGKTHSNLAKWQDFLDTLAPKTRIGEDPHTGEVGILYRDGEWLGDLMLADDLHSMSLMPDVVRIRGDFIARNARVVNKAFTHEVEILGGLHIHHEVLRHDPPNIHYSGYLRLYGIRTPANAPSLTPDRLMAWGVATGTTIRMRSETYEFRADDSGVTVSYVLEGVNNLSAYAWKGGKWMRFTQERLDPASLETVFAKLSRASLVLGLGSDFVAKSVSRMQDNIDRLCLYLDYSLEGLAESPAPDDPAARSAVNIMEILGTLRKPFEQRKVNAETMLNIAEELDEQELEAAAALAEKPRYKHNAKLVTQDLKRVTKLVDDEIRPQVLLGMGLKTVRALSLVLQSSGMQANLRKAFERLVSELEALCEGMPKESRPTFRDLVESPRATLADIRDRRGGNSEDEEFAHFEADLREVQSLSGKEIVRKIVNVPDAEDSEEFAQDRKLLRTLFEMQGGEVDSLQIPPAALLAFILPRLESGVGPRLLRAFWIERRGGAQESLLDRAVSARFAGLSLAETAQELRHWVRLHEAVVHQYNSLTRIDASMETDDDAAAPVVALPPHVLRDVANRLNRAALLIGPGRSFLDQNTEALRDNTQKILAYVKLAMGLHPALSGTLLDRDSMVILNDFKKKLEAILHGLDSGDPDSIEDIMPGLSDAALNEVAHILSKPRKTVDTTAIRHDLRYLDGLKDTRLTLEKVFEGSGKFLLFANSCLESKQLKRAVSAYLKPIYIGLTKLGSAAGGVSMNELVRSSCNPKGVLARIDGAADRQSDEKIRKGLEAICSKTIKDIVSDLRKSGKGDEEDVKRDNELLGLVLALPGNALGRLRLDPKRTSLLLLLNLESYFSSTVKIMFESGVLANKSSKRVVTILHSKLKWDYDVIRVYNKLSTPAK